MCQARRGHTAEARTPIARALNEAVLRHLLHHDQIDPARLELRAVGPDEPIDTRANHHRKVLEETP